MSQVSYVDPALIERTAGFLFDQQNANGSWSPWWVTSEMSREQMAAYNLGTTAYIAWALADAGYGQTDSIQRAVQYLKDELAYVDKLNKDSGGTFASPLPTPEIVDALGVSNLTIIANALIAVDDADPQAKALLDWLVTQANLEDGRLYFWHALTPTYLGSRGTPADFEVTAKIAIALMRSGQHPDVAQGALDFLLSRRNPYGSFYTTQATIWALKALIMDSKQQQAQAGPATVTITLNGGRTQTITPGRDQRRRGAADHL